MIKMRFRVEAFFCDACFKEWALWNRRWVLRPYDPALDGVVKRCNTKGCERPSTQMARMDVEPSFMRTLSNNNQHRLRQGRPYDDKESYCQVLLMESQVHALIAALDHYEPAESGCAEDQEEAELVNDVRDHLNSLVAIKEHIPVAKRKPSQPIRARDKECCPRITNLCSLCTHIGGDTCLCRVCRPDRVERLRAEAQS